MKKTLSRTTKKQIEQLLKEVTQLLKNKKVTTAIEKLEKVLTIDDANIQVITQLGTIYLDTHDYNKAIEKFSATIKMVPTDAINYSQRACAYLFLNNSKLALNDFQTAKQLGLNFPELDINIANCYRRLNDATTALDILNTLNAAHPNNGEIYYNLALTYLCLNKAANALDCLMKAKQLKFPTTKDFNASLAETYRKLGDPDKAIKYLEKTLAGCENALEIAGTQEDLGQVYHHKHAFKEAIIYYEEAIKIRSSIKCLVNLSACYLSLENYKTLENCAIAKKYALAALEINPHDEKALQNWLCANSRETAIKKASPIKKVNIPPKLPKASQVSSQPQISKSANELFEDGITCLMQGNYSQAITNFTDVNTLKGVAHRELGIAYHLNGDLDEALSAYNKAIDSQSSNINAHYLFERGIINFELENFPKALEDFEKTLKTQAPEDAINLSEVKDYIQKAQEKINDTKNSTEKKDAQPEEEKSEETECGLRFR